MPNMLFRSRVCAALVLLAGPIGSLAQDNALPVTLEWIRAEKLISQERADWEQERVVLEDLVTLLERESVLLEEEYTTVEAELGDIAARAESLNQREDAVDAELARFARLMPVWAKAVGEVQPTWPTPLQIQIRDELDAVDTPPPTPDGWLDHAETWTGILRQVDDFDAQITVHRDVASLTSNDVWEVQEIYFGLAGGYWTTPDGGRGGRLAPGPTGWTRENEPAVAPAARRLIAIAERREPAAHVDAPLVVD